MESTSPLPIAEALSKERPKFGQWSDYRNLGITSQHVPELMRIAANREFDFFDRDDPLVYAPVHAWRALAQLGIVEIVTILLDGLDWYGKDFDEFTVDDFAHVVTQIGPDSLPLLVDYLRHKGKWGPNYTSVTSAMTDLAMACPQVRDQVVLEFRSHLERWPENGPEFNGGLIEGLVRLKVMDAMTLIREAMKAGAVDELITGSIEWVEYDLGLHERPTGHRYQQLQQAFDNQNNESGEFPLVASTESANRGKRNAKERAQARRKQARTSKKRNRRK